MKNMLAFVVLCCMTISSVTSAELIREIPNRIRYYDDGSYMVFSSDEWRKISVGSYIKFFESTVLNKNTVYLFWGTSLVPIYDPITYMSVVENRKQQSNGEWVPDWTHVVPLDSLQEAFVLEKMPIMLGLMKFIPGPGHDLFVVADDSTPTPTPTAFPTYFEPFIITAEEAGEVQLNEVRSVVFEIKPNFDFAGGFSVIFEPGFGEEIEMSGSGRTKAFKYVLAATQTGIFSKKVTVKTNQEVENKGVVEYSFVYTYTVVQRYTPTATSTATKTPVPTATPTPTNTPKRVNLPEAPTVTPTTTKIPTPTKIPTLTSTSTPTPTPTNTPISLPEGMVEGGEVVSLWDVDEEIYLLVKIREGYFDGGIPSDYVPYLVSIPDDWSFLVKGSITSEGYWKFFLKRNQLYQVIPAAREDNENVASVNWLIRENLPLEDQKFWSDNPEALVVDTRNGSVGMGP